MRHVPVNAWRPKGVSSLEPAANEAVRDLSSTLIVAGPGAGKTELLAQRASFLLETATCPEPKRILAISFKRDAAHNLRERVALRCGPQLARRFDSYTFDAWAKSLIDRFLPALPTNYRPTADYLIDETFTYERPLRDRLLAICDLAGISSEKIHGLDINAFVKKGISDRAIDPSATPTAGSGMALVNALWNSTLHSGNKSVLGFPMLGVLAELLLRQNPLLVAAIRESYGFVFLDEFQDTTVSQYRLLHTAFHGSSAVLTAVGDHKQRIMLWAGAHIGAFEAYLRDFEASRKGLIMNYRSAPDLVSIQEHLIMALDANSPIPRAADDGAAGRGECRVFSFCDDAVEARHLASLIAGWITSEGLHPRDICVLTRQTVDRYTKRLREELEQHGIKSRVQDKLQDLLAEPLTKLVVDAITLCTTAAPKNWLSLSTQIIQLSGLDEEGPDTRKLINRLSVLIGEIRSQLVNITSIDDVTEIIHRLIAFIGESTFCQHFEQYLQAEYLEKIIALCAHHLADARERSANWSEALEDFLGLNCIPIMSIHKSKGLEYHTVVMIGLEDWPFRNIRSGNLEEGCNFFVAFSRAKKRVIFTFANIRTDTGSAKPQSRSDVAQFYQLLARAGVTVEQIP